MWGWGIEEGVEEVGLLAEEGGFWCVLAWMVGGRGGDVYGGCDLSCGARGRGRGLRM